jgi:hypothetical protein
MLSSLTAAIMRRVAALTLLCSALARCASAVVSALLSPVELLLLLSCIQESSSRSCGCISMCVVVVLAAVLAAVFAGDVLVTIYASGNIICRQQS